ncbi:Entomoglyceroporin-2 [Rhyzopertha dominica]|nr:Entomoglyceroporin-2 [Rhyzopertha dominica]
MSLKAIQDQYITLYRKITIIEAVQLFLAECFGTAILVLIGCLGCVEGITHGVFPILHKALSFGLAVLGAIQCFGHVSGAHINPCLSLSAVILGFLPLNLLPLYIVAQVIGAVIGFGCLKPFTASQYIKGNNDTIGVCSPFINSEISVLQGFYVELLASFILVLFTCGVWDPRNENKGDSVAMKFGLFVAVLASVFSPYTGTQINPARSFGPALWNGDWQHHWVNIIYCFQTCILNGEAYVFKN